MKANAKALEVAAEGHRASEATHIAGRRRGLELSATSARTRYGAAAAAPVIA
jgi:hypothetical protein